MIERSANDQGKIEIPVTLQYLLTFLLLTYLCYEAHELFHHLSGAVLCGGFGKMTFTLFETKPGCQQAYLVTLAGPLLTFVLAWVGAYLLFQRKHMLFAYTLIFATFAHSRFLLPIIGGGDEWYLARTHLHQPNRFALVILLFVLGLHPLILAFRAIANPRPLLVFMASWFLPVLVYGPLPMVDEWLFASDLNNAGASLVGIPAAVLVTDLIAIMAYIFVGHKSLARHASTSGSEQLQTS